MELQALVQNELDKIITSGKVEEFIHSTLEKSIKDIIENTLREYSDFGKSLKAEIGKVLNINLTNLDILDYNHIIQTAIRDTLDKTLLDSVQKPITDFIKSYTGDLEKKEWRLSEIKQRLVDTIDEEYGQNTSGEITINVEGEAGRYKHVYLDIDSNVDNYKCEYNIMLNSDGIVWSFVAGKYVPTSGNILQTPIHGEFASFLFKLYAMGCKVIIDDVDAYWGKED